MLQAVFKIGVAFWGNFIGGFWVLVKSERTYRKGGLVFTSLAYTALEDTRRVLRTAGLSGRSLGAMDAIRLKRPCVVLRREFPGNFYK
jgi:hypothetical protein